jgi:nucleoside-diphosphate-sugar epimerase
VSVEFGPVRPGDLAPRVVVSDRAREVLGWAPEVGIDEGVRQTFAWYVGARAEAAARAHEAVGG